jgi:hypothetical protein
MDTAEKVRWWQTALKPKQVPSVRTHGILGVAVSILGWAVAIALAIGCNVVLGAESGLLTGVPGAIIVFRSHAIASERPSPLSKS